MKSIPEHYYNFWAKMFNLSLDQIQSSNVEIVTTGHYVEKHKEAYIFFYRDLFNGKTICAASAENMKKINGTFKINDLSSMDSQTIRNIGPFAKMDLAFCDIDYCLLDTSSLKLFTAHNFDIRILSESNLTAIEKFYARISEDEKDVLDLNLEKDFGIALFDDDGSIVGISRYFPIRYAMNLADVSVVIDSRARGKRYGSALVSAIIQNLLKKNLNLKYRVKEDNHSSIQIAKKLGLVPGFHLLAFKV